MAKKKNLGATAEFRIRRKKKNGLKLWQKFIIGLCGTVLSLIVIAVIVLGGAIWYFQNHDVTSSIDEGDTESELLLPPPDVSDDNDELDNDVPSYKRKEDTYTFLILGSDRAKWLTDVIMIATYDTVNQKFAIMQIPRDTYVMVNSKLLTDEDGNITYDNFDGKGDYGCKLNSVVWHGGSLAGKELARIASLARDTDKDSELDKICEESFLNLTTEELKSYLNSNGKEKNNLEYNIKLKFGIKYLTALLARSFGTPIDFYAQLNLDGFVNIVNAIGGVDVYIQEDMDYEDPLQDPPLKIHLKKGMQHLDGKKAEQFIRFRYGYAAADIARIDAQKIFMTAFIKKVVSLEGIANIDKLITEVISNLTTNLSITDTGFFGTQVFELDFNNIVMLTLPGWPLYVDGVSYYSVDKDSMMQTVNDYLNKYTEPLTEEYFCAIEAGPGTNYTTPPLTAEEIQNEQPDLGFMY